MRRFITTVVSTFAAITIAVVVMAQTKNQSPLIDMPDSKASARGGACMPIAAAATAVATDNATAVSTAQLSAFACYLFQCDDDTAMRPGTASTGQAAVSGTDLWLPTGAWVKLCTTGDVRYFSFINKNTDSSCRYLECR